MVTRLPVAIPVSGGKERRGQQRSKSAVLNSALSGGLNGGVAGGKPLIKLNQIPFKTQLTCYSRGSRYIFLTLTSLGRKRLCRFRLLLLTVNEDWILDASTLYLMSLI